MGFDEAAEARRASAPREAEAKAVAVFDDVIARGIGVPGASESPVGDAVRVLAEALSATRRYWHKRLVRAGVNTLEPFAADPPERVLAADDICYLDFGPIF